MKRIYSIILILIFCQPLYPQVDLNEGLLAYYPFNGNSVDVSGSGNDGTVFGAILAEDRFENPNSAYFFDGIDDYIRVPDDNSLDFTDAFTITAWINSNNNSGPKGIVNDSQLSYYFKIHNDSDKLRIELTNSSGNIVELEGNTSIPLDTWTFVAVTFGNGFAKLYVDGELDSQVSVSGNLESGGDPILVGTNGEGSGESFSGFIDELRIYNITLNDESIKKLFTAVTLTFQADMSRLIGEGFNPDVHSIEIRGNFYANRNNWESGPSLIPTEDNIYKVSLVVGSEGDNIAWKFKTLPEEMFFNGGWENMGNYEITLPGTDLVLDPVYPKCYFENPNEGSTYFYGNSRIRVLDSSPVNPAANNGAYEITGHALTIEAWVFPTELPLHYSNTTIVSRPYNDVPRRAYDLTISNHGETDNPTYTFGISNGQTAVYSADPTAAIVGNWIHLAGTYDGSFARLYVNGALVSEIPYTEPIGPGETGFYIGGLSSEYFDGLIDEVRIWNVVRSEDEINELMNATLNGDEPGLMGYWPLDEATTVDGNFPVTIDITENHNDLWVQNTATFVGFTPGSEVAIAPLIVDTDIHLGVATVGEYFETTISSSGYPSPIFSISNQPVGMDIDENTGIIFWIPQPGHGGNKSFQINVSNEHGSDSKTFSIWVNETPLEQLVHSNGNLRFSVYNDGVLGNNTYREGEGFNLNGHNGLYSANLIVGQNADQVSGMLFDVEFGIKGSINQIGSVWEGFDQVYYTEYNDMGAPNPIGIDILQRSHCISTDASRNFIIVEYAVINNSNARIDDLYIGLATDWDIGDTRNNLGGFDDTRKLSYMYENPASAANIINPYYYGVVALNSQVSGHRVWINGVDFDVNSDISYYEALTQRYDILTDPGDMRAILGTGPYSIPSGVMAKAVFAFVAGENLEDLQRQADDAIASYEPFAPSINLNSPNGGENLEVGSTYEITWDSQNVETVVLVYSTDNTGTWNIIATEDASNGSYTWTVPNTISSECFVGVTDVNDINVNDISDSPFTISAALLTYTTEYFADDFEDGDALGWELNNGWHVANVNGNHVLAAGDPNWQGAFIGDYSWKNYRVSIDLNILSGAMQFSFRNNSNNERYILGLNSDNGLFTFAKSDSQTSNRIDEANIPIQSNQWHSLAVYCYEGDFRIYFNDNLLFSHSDPSPIQSGRIWIENAPNSSIHIDNVRIVGELELVCNPSSRNVTSGAGSTTFTILSNSSWNVNSDANWLTFNPTTGAGEETINVNYYANAATTSRSASIVVSATNASATEAPITCTLTQAGNSYPTTITLSNTVSFPSYSDPADYSYNDYRLVGFPGNSNNYISSFMSGEQGTDWEVYWDIGSGDTRTDYYRRFSESDVFRCSTGKAFWVINKGTWNVSNVSVNSADLGNDGNIAIPIPDIRWNLITNPYWASVPWSAINAINENVHAPVYWDGSSLTVAGSLEPYRGYLFDNTPPRSELLIPFPSGQTLNKNEENALDWGIDIVVSNGQFEDRTTQLGVSEYADNSLDFYDVGKARIFGDIPMAYFPRPEWDEDYSKFRSDIRKEIDGVGEWDFIVSSKLNQDITLTFESVLDVPAEYEVFLLDKNRAQSVNLREDMTYTFTSTRTETPMSLLIGERDLIDNEIEKLIPKDYELMNNYPNPFNLGTKIGVKLPNSDEVILEIYNVLGQRIRTIYHGTLDSGIHYFDWDGRDESGSVVTSGIYLYKMNTLSKIISKKMVLIK